MASFGAELKRERELRDISLKEISEATKISIRFLEALEQDNYDVLPGGIFNRGFIRAYARFIGVDGEEMVNAYLNEVSQREPDLAGVPRVEPIAKKTMILPAPTNGGTAPRPEPKLPRAETKREKEPRPAQPTPRSSPPPDRASAMEGRTSMALWVLAVVAFILGAGVLVMSLMGKEGAATTKVSVPGTSPVETASPVPGIATAQGGVPVNASPEPVVGGVVEPQSPQLTADAPGLSTGGLPPGQATPAEPRPVERVIRIQATEATRVRIECGTSLSLDQELWPGQVRTISCVEPIVLSADNGGAVHYAIDGNPTALLGAMGQRVEGLQVSPQPSSQASPPGGARAQGPTGAVHGQP